MNRLPHTSAGRSPARKLSTGVAMLGAIIGGGFSFHALAQADLARFHDPPPSADEMRNPFATQANAIDAGKASYAAHCAACHGASGQGNGNVPPLASSKVKGASPGALFWFISKGNINGGMPAWNALPEQERWNLVSFAQSLVWNCLPADSIIHDCCVPHPMAMSSWRKRAQGVSPCFGGSRRTAIQRKRTFS